MAVRHRRQLFLCEKLITYNNKNSYVMYKTCIPVVKFLSENILTPETYSTVHTCKQEIILNFAKTLINVLTLL